MKTLRKAIDIVCDYCVRYCCDESCPVHDIQTYHSDILDKEEKDAES